jgi:hypothetical protein
MRFLQGRSCSDSVLGELVHYNQIRFESDVTTGVWPLDDEAHISAWKDYFKQAGKIEVTALLRRIFIQLNFPIQKDIANHPDYRAARGRGILPAEAGTVAEFFSPDQIAFEIHQSPAGAIPVLDLGDRRDFETLIQALFKKNQPTPIPAAQGAAMVAGYNNWDRVRQLKQDFLQTSQNESWGVFFREKVVPQKSLYQDRFILLSRGGYSDVTATAIQINESEWLDLSRTIRLHHECAHYFTRRVLGSMRNHFHDELIADYCGIVAANGRFRSDWFLLFMGLEAFPKIRKGGRSENYLGNPPLSNAAAAIQREILCAAALAVERFHDRHSQILNGIAGQAKAILTLSRTSLVQMAGPQAADHLDAALKSVKG